jgi:hypothetical protein
MKTDGCVRCPALLKTGDLMDRTDPLNSMAPRLAKGEHLASPDLEPAMKEQLVSGLMKARRAMVPNAELDGDLEAGMAAHRAVAVTKRGLGEGKPVWWSEAAPDLTCHTVKNTHCATECAWLRKQTAAA